MKKLEARPADMKQQIPERFNPDQLFVVFLSAFQYLWYDTYSKTLAQTFPFRIPLHTDFLPGYSDFRLAYSPVNYGTAQRHGFSSFV